MILYKYAGGDSGLKILENLRLKITPPNEFNDPFEITPNTRRSRPLAEMVAGATKDSHYFRSVYDDMVENGENVGTFDQFIRDMPAAIPKYYSPYKKLSRQEMIKRDLGALDEVSLQLGVLCLSKPRDNIPMWSYYGDHHRGIVFGINVNSIGGRLPGKSGFVKYCKNRVRLNPFASQPLAVSQRERVLFTKSHQWRHEEEYRRGFLLSDLVSQMSAANGLKRYFLDISGNSIEEIILGCRISSETEGKIRQQLARRKRTFGHVRLLRCERHVSKFVLKVVGGG